MKTKTHNKTISVSLSELSQDEAILEIRKVNVMFVSRYRQAMRAGDKFPPLLVDQNNQIVSGNHRYQAYNEEYPKEHKVEVIRKTYTTEAERIADAIKDNTRHGNPLDGISRKRAAVKLIELGMSEEAIASLIGVSVRKLEEIAGMTVCVRGQGQAPVKRGLEHMAGKTVTKANYQEHINRDMGISIKRNAEQIIRWINNGWVDLSDKSVIETLSELNEVLTSKIQ
jgi:hypothetical protein